MRSLLVASIIFGSLPFILWRPWIGVLVWAWVGYMSPHRLTFGFAYDYPFAQIVAVVTLVSSVLHLFDLRLRLTRELFLLMALLSWFTITTFTAFIPELAWYRWTEVMKIQLMVILTLLVMWSKERLNLLIWVMVGSLAYYGVKGGIYTVVTGGASSVTGPEQTFIEGNTDIALALVMVIPLMRYLHLHTKRKLVRWGLAAGMVFMVAGVFGTYSRGGLVALAIAGMFFWAKSRRKVMIAGALIATIPFLVLAMPDRWMDRMSGIKNYQEDDSAKGRFNSWRFAVNLAMDKPVTGAGFGAFSPPLFDIYSPNPDIHLDAHSIYMKILGEHGFVGLGLFLLLGLSTWRSTVWIRRHAASRKDLRWAVDLATMVQISLIGYAVGGAFLGMAYYDLPYGIMALVINSKVIVREELASAPAAEEEEEVVPRRLTLAHSS